MLRHSARRHRLSPPARAATTAVGQANDRVTNGSDSSSRAECHDGDIALAGALLAHSRPPGQATAMFCVDDFRVRARIKDEVSLLVLLRGMVGTVRF